MSPSRAPKALAIAAAMTLWAAAPAAHAHLGSTKYILAEPTAVGVHLEIAVDVVDASMELGLGEEGDQVALSARPGAIGRWLAGGISVWGAGGACEAVAGAPDFATRDARPFVEVSIDYTCPAPVRDLRLRDDTIFDDDPQHEAFVRIRWSDESDARILRRGHREAPLGEPPSVGSLIETYLLEGSLHLASGIDHVLFLLSLVLAAGLVAVRQGRRKALRDVAVLVTAFTVGHSVTLIAAALEVVVLPSRLVESAIALSIMVVAGLNLWAPEARRGIPWLAGGFGLVHGFGFSSVLAEQGLPRGQQVLALVSFNVGIELAQLIFVAAILGPLAWLARYESYRPVVVRGGSAVILLVAAAWLVERALGI